MTASDPFHVLGLQPGAPRDEVRRAYRKLAMRWHPDRNQHSRTSEERFKHIKAAYEIAIDESAYQAWRDSRPVSPPGASDEASQERDAAQGAETAEDSMPVEQTLELSLEEAARGGRRTIRVDRQAPCRSCAGAGRVVQAHSTPCRQCQGIGRRFGKGLAATEKCPDCSGRGYVRHADCAACEGRGHSTAQSVFEVLVPVGLRHGETLRLTRRGGSILLRIVHQPHPFFTLQGNDLHCAVPVDVLTLLAGGDIEVPTLSRLIRVPLPAAASASEIRLVGNGFPSRHGKAAGDLVLALQAIYPKDLTVAETTALRHLAAALNGRLPELRDWQRRIEQRRTQTPG